MPFERTIYSTLEECLAGVDLVVEATRFEELCLWEKWNTKVKWKQDMGVWLPTVGELEDRPVVISCMFSTIGDKFVLFYHPTSVVVDYKQIEDYLKKMCPVVNKVGFKDAMNVSLHHFSK
jgi:hypothetical protein